MTDPTGPADPGLTPEDYVRIHTLILSSNDIRDRAIQDRIKRYLDARRIWQDDAGRRRTGTPL